jgi:hypothetical protein
MQLKVDGTNFELTVQDYGGHWKVRVYQNNRVIGVKDFPIKTDLGNGVLTYTVRSMLKGQNEKSATL